MATAWTNQSKNSTSYTNVSNAGYSVIGGNPIGLLLVLTSDLITPTAYSNQTKNTTNYTNLTKN